MIARLFPWTLIILSMLASVVYFWHGDWRRGCYWLFAACLNISVTV